MSGKAALGRVPHFSRLLREVGTSPPASTTSNPKNADVAALQFERCPSGDSLPREPALGEAEGSGRAKLNGLSPAAAKLRHYLPLSLKSKPHHYFFAGFSSFGVGAAEGRELSLGCAAAGLCCCHVLNFCACCCSCCGLRSCTGGAGLTSGCACTGAA